MVAFIHGFFFLVLFLMIELDFGLNSFMNYSYLMIWLSFLYPILNHKSCISYLEIYTFKYFIQITRKSVILKWPSQSQSKEVKMSLRFKSFTFFKLLLIFNIFFQFFIIVASKSKKFFFVQTSTSESDFICLFFSILEYAFSQTSNILQNELKSIFP